MTSSSPTRTPLRVRSRSTAEAARDGWPALAPPPALTISQWADRYRRISAEDSAEPGEWRTSRTEYLRGIMDACCDPAVREVVILKAAQLGATQLLFNVAGYFIHLDPSPILWVNTTIGGSETFSKDRFEPFRRDNPVIAERIPSPKARDGENTVLDKRFPGGRLLFRGANSPASLRSHPIRVLLMDEVDGYPATTSEGEPTKLAQKRTKAFWNRLIVKGSTAGDAATSRASAPPTRPAIGASSWSPARIPTAATSRRCPGRGCSGTRPPGGTSPRPRRTPARAAAASGRTPSATPRSPRAAGRPARRSADHLGRGGECGERRLLRTC